MKGFSLLELILVLAIASAVSFIRFQDLKQDQENVQAKVAGEQLKQLGEAVNSYISIRYNKLSTLTAATGTGTDPGPRTCTGSVCTITYQTLINEGLLPSSFTGVNINKSAYTILLKRNGTAPNYVINGLITTNAAWTEGNRVRYDLLGKAMHTAGVDSGMSKLANQISGYSGLWSETTSGFSSINKVGLLGYRVGYDSSMYSVYLRRDGTLPMTGDLDMGGNDINNAGSITASGTGNFGASVKSGGNVTATTGFGDLITLGGDKVNRDYEMILHAQGLPLIIHDTKNSTDSTILRTYGNIDAYGNINASKNIVASGTLYGRQVEVKNGYGDTITIGGDGAGEDYEIRLSGDRPLTLWSHTGTTAGASTQTRFQVWGKQYNKGDLVLNASGDATGMITASGNISSGGTVSGQYLQPTSTVVAGEACSPNGLISKISDGSLLNCIDGVWKSPVSLQTMTSVLGGDHQNYGDICQRHLDNNGFSALGWVVTGSDVCTEDEHYCTIDNVKCYAIKLK